MYDHTKKYLILRILPPTHRVRGKVMFLVCLSVQGGGVHPTMVEGLDIGGTYTLDIGYPSMDMGGPPDIGYPSRHRGTPTGATPGGWIWN